MTFETFDQGDEVTWPDQQKDNDKDKYKDKDNDKDKDILRTPPKSNPRDLWPLRHLFRVMRRHDMTKKIDKDKYKDKDNDKDKEKTFWEHLLRAILETCDLWDICSEWLEDMTWPKTLKKDKYKDNDKEENCQNGKNVKIVK